MAHTATTYASCLALALTGSTCAYDTVHRKKLYRFFMSLKDEETGAFCAHKDG